MLEHYYVKPSTIDRIRNSWLGSQIDNYVGWMKANGYSSRTVFRRLPRLFYFAEFTQKRGCTDAVSALALVDEFVSEWLVQHGAGAKTSASLRKHAIDVGNATRQMLRLAGGSPLKVLESRGFRLSRPVKWSRDLHSIRERAANARTETWGRVDMEELFGVGRVTAQTLMKAIGEVQSVGGAPLR